MRPIRPITGWNCGRQLERFKICQRAPRSKSEPTASMLFAALQFGGSSGKKMVGWLNPKNQLKTSIFGNNLLRFPISTKLLGSGSKATRVISITQKWIKSHTNEPQTAKTYQYRNTKERDNKASGASQIRNPNSKNKQAFSIREIAEQFAPPMNYPVLDFGAIVWR